MDYFEFKQFRVYHDRCAMKVGTDGVLLGAWADVENSKRILDIGCGTGLIALMVAQRSNAEVVGIDIDSNAAEQASENAEASPFSKCITIKRADILKYEDTTGFDTIISNPPFFVEDTLSPNMKRSLARHASSLHFEDLISKSIELMRPGASFQIILPTQNAKRFGDLCTLKKLSLVRRTDIITKKGGLPKRTMMHYINRINATMPVFSQLTINDENNGRTPEYTELTNDYYL